MQDMKLRRAIRWISGRLQEQAAADRVELINTAGLRFALNPKQEQFLHHMYLRAG
jgi:hypothetical protein